MAKKDFQHITDTMAYARANRINPVKPETWDYNYKRRMQKLAGILPNVKDDIKKLEEAIKLSKKIK